MTPRRPRMYILRTVYGAALLLLISTAWMILNGTQIIRNVGDMARFGTTLFQVLAPLQLALLMFLAAIQSASTVSVEKDRQTLILLLITRLTNAELVLGKLLASLLSVFSMMLVGLPILMLTVLFGGTSFQQVGWTFAVTVVTCVAAGAIGTTIAFWREKTFQTLALVVITLVAWIG
ncbi:MAG TPA: ABC-2 transporter permease, partial [Pirellulaceae bacterium]|nr:ABC-2 transporter permease [Pirellulaceae bacterium]